MPASCVRSKIRSTPRLQVLHLCDLVDRQAITRAISEQSHMIRIPVHMAETTAKVRGIKRTRTEDGVEPTVEETALAAEMSIEDVRRIEAIDRSPVSLDRSVGSGEDCAYGDLISDRNAACPSRVPQWTVFAENEHCTPLARLSRA